MHEEYLNTAPSGGGTFSYYFDMPLAGFETSELGYGPVYPAFIQGRAAYALLSLYQQTCDPTALTLGRSLLEFLQSWKAPYSATGSTLLPSSSDGAFQDHIYSVEQGVFALIADAEIRRKADPTDPVAQEELAQADNIYRFIKDVTLAGLVGNFGETGTSGEMIRIAIQLTDNEVGSYFDEAEFWTRNLLAESQIPGDTGVGGMFWSDATHVFAIPTNAKNFRYNVDGSANAIIAMHDVWDHVVTLKGTTALVNFLLNRASPHITVRSDLPYRGQVEVQTAPNLGSLTELAVRVPSWADHDGSVTITSRGAAGGETELIQGTDWVWAGAYAYVVHIEPNTIYTLRFPIKVHVANVYEMRGPDTFWYEGSRPNPLGPEEITTYTGTFRGYELVSVEPAPGYSGVLRFQRQDLAALPPTDVAPPMRSVVRFIHHGTSESIPIAMP